MSETNEDDTKLNRRGFLKKAAAAGGAFVAGAVGMKMLSQEKEKNRKDPIAASLEGQVSDIPLDSKLFVDQLKEKYGVEPNKDHIDLFRAYAKSEKGHTGNDFAVVGRPPDSPNHWPRMFLMNKLYVTELLPYRRDLQNGTEVNWYIPGKDDPSGKGIPGAEGAQFVLSYFNYKDGPESQQGPSVLYYTPPEKQKPELVGVNYVLNRSVQLDATKLSPTTRQDLREIKPAT